MVVEGKNVKAINLEIERVYCRCGGQCLSMVLPLGFPSELQLVSGSDSFTISSLCLICLF